MTHSEIKELFEYNAWANRRVIDSIIPLTLEQFSQNLGGSHASIRGTLAPLAAAEKLWLERWQLRQAGAIPIPTDLIIYYRQIRVPLS
jgi:uncharacterized damage-inducible protein DinB